jgi:aspartate aminotransferase
MYDEATIKAICQLAIKHDLWIIWDEIYEQLIYGDNKHYHPQQLVPEIADRVITINGVSKTYAMTGWRIGYALGPKSVLGKINAFQSHLTSGATSIAQWAAVGAMREGSEDKQKMYEAFKARRDLICGLLKAMPYVEFPEPQGAFYVFVSVKKSLGKTWNGKVLKDDFDFCDALLESELVAVVPGSSFFAPGYLRVSYATSAEIIKEGMQRLQRFLEQLQ